ncbi:MAG TPA: type II CAAX endopeptidase family protein [Mucilaginibacter sp.]|nr:type II CAAX endopeptidase family protein [Mucilaginibacter sp.]
MEKAVNQNRKAIALFLLFTIGLSAIFYFLIIHTGKLGSGFGIYVMGLMWCPGLSALITSKVLKRKVSEIAWQWSKSIYMLWAYLVPFIYALVAYLIIWSAGWGGFFNKNFVNQVAGSFGWQHLPNGLVIFLYFVFMGIFGMVQNSAAALGEEIGWRGFLVPELYKITSYTKTSLITGIVWAVWHYPILIFADYNSGTPVWYGLTCFTVMVISSSFILTWFRLKSNSLWPAVILHASHNLFIQAFFTPLTRDTGHTKYFIDEFGIVLSLTSLAAAVFFWAKRGQLTRTPG